jgi:hypothetical protein
MTAFLIVFWRLENRYFFQLQEKERLSQTDFSKLLSIDTFHHSLLACSVEIILMTYGRTCKS